MGCPAEVVIGDNLVFSICSHNATTGVLTDADSAPTYRVYEDETATPILTGTMAKLDDANTTGFYTESIACTSGNGFENGKTYTIYIEAIVAGATAGVAYGLKAVDPAWTTAITEAYGTDGSALTPAQLLYLILANVSEFAIVGTTKTCKKLDGSTTAATYTLNSATTPSSITRAT